jgi:hypothetical protein
MPDYYSFEVTLKGVMPRIWRRFLLRTDAMFLGLHEAIQDASGWEHRHLFQFKDARGRVLAGLPDGPDDVTTPDAKINRLDEVFGRKEGAKIQYVYDLGDYWEHGVELVDVVDGRTDQLSRRLLAGERAFPPEDCGGLPGYEECVLVARGRTKDGERLKWLAGWHPERFDFKKTARRFNQTRLRRRARYRSSWLSEDQ